MEFGLLKQQTRVLVVVPLLCSLGMCFVLLHLSSSGKGRDNFMSESDRIKKTGQGFSVVVLQARAPTPIELSKPKCGITAVGSMNQTLLML